MIAARRPVIDYDEYLRLLDTSQIKLEFIAGQVYAMSGGTFTHAELAAAMTAVLRGRAPRGCRVYSGDLKIRIDAVDVTTFPDVSISCGKRTASSVDRHALINPCLLVEVTSRSTEAYDRGAKLKHYQRLPSVRAVLFVSQRAPRITVVERTRQGWKQREVEAGAWVELDGPRMAFPVDEVYAGIELDDG